MKRNIISSMVATTVAFAIIGCGGGGSSSATTTPTTVTGVFQDAKVAGLDYQCSSGKKDVTNANAEFTCNAGDTVTFSIGGYVLGSTTASSGIVTPATLYPDDETAAVNVMQVLQSIEDASDGIIEIPDNFNALDDVTVPPTDANFDTVIETKLQEAGLTLVSEENAQAHMLETLLKGNTLYTTIWDETGTLEEWTFSDDLSRVAWKELEGCGQNCENGSGTLSISNGLILTYTEGNETSTITVNAIGADYLNVTAITVENNESITENLRLYYDKSKAEKYFLSTVTDAVLGSWYLGDASQSNDIVVLTFFANGYYVMLEDGGDNDPDGQDGMERGTYSIDTNGGITINTIVDTNGEWGLSNPSSQMVLSVNTSNNTMTITEGSDTYTASRVENNGVIGSWYMGDASQNDNIVVFTLFANGYYVMLEDGTTDNGGHDGIEHGSYTIDVNGNVTVNTLVDTNGDWGLSDTSNLNISVNNDTMTIRDGSDEFNATRVPQ